MDRKVDLFHFLGGCSSAYIKLTQKISTSITILDTNVIFEEKNTKNKETNQKQKAKSKNKEQNKTKYFLVVNNAFAILGYRNLCYEICVKW